MQLRDGLLLLILVTAPAAALEPPRPERDPGEVVQLQLQGLQQADAAGFEQAFTLASPGNQAQTGPLPRFVAMLREGYPELLGHRQAELGGILIEGEQALVPVRLQARNGLSFQYVFLLSRQTEPPFVDCWMTDAVLGEPERADEQAL
ncbi:MAG TPA: DUF4864 domain-containing protein [Nevskiaceae bacterium]|nr:DUF4864 domain-containing protein [Nevskiaceae bacterium]